MKDRAMFFLHDATIILFLLLPAFGAWVAGSLVLVGVYDVEIKNVNSERKLFLESGVFEEEVRRRVDEITVKDIYARKQ